MTRQAVDGLVATHLDMQATFEGLTPDEWQLPSGCSGWRVQDVLAHVTSNFAEMVAPSPAPAEPPPPMTAEQAMEALVAPRKPWSVAELLDEYARTREGAFAALGAMQEEPLASTEIPVADLGTYAMHWLANAYCFDHYCHLRHDLLAPGGPLADRREAGGFAVVEESSAVAPVATVSSSAHDFVSWGTTRSGWRAACSLRGDGDAAAAFLDALNIV